MSAELAGIHPTRLELLRLRRRKAMAEGIIDILKKDLEALTMKLFDFVKEIPPLRKSISQALSTSYTLFKEAEMIVGSQKLEETSLTVHSVDFDITINEESGILGIMLPQFQLKEDIGQTLRPRFSLLDTPAKIDESTVSIRTALQHIIFLAEREASMREILEVMALKRRQINRVQYKVLPHLDAAIRYIELILEETERQDAIRVRVLQRKRKERAQRTV